MALEVLDQKIPGWLIVIIFLGEDETANRLVFKAMLGIWAFSMSDAIF